MNQSIAHHSRTVLIGLVCMLCVFALSGCKSKANVEQPPAITGEPPIEWQLTTMQGAAVAVERPVTLRLGKDGAMTGQSFVNSYFGSANVGPDGAISLSQVGSTMMAASEELMNSEQEYFQLLSRVNRYRATAETLTLLHDEEALLEFVRHAG